MDHGSVSENGKSDMKGAAPSRKRARNGEDAPKKQRRGGLLAAMKKYAATRAHDPDIKEILPQIPKQQLPPRRALEQPPGKGQHLGIGGCSGTQQPAGAAAGVAEGLQQHEVAEQEQLQLQLYQAQLYQAQMQQQALSASQHVLPVVVPLMAPPNHLYMQQHSMSMQELEAQLGGACLHSAAATAAAAAAAAEQPVPMVGWPDPAAMAAASAAAAAAAAAEAACGEQLLAALQGSDTLPQAGGAAATAAGPSSRSQQAPCDRQLGEQQRQRQRPQSRRQHRRQRAKEREEEEEGGEEEEAGQQLEQQLGGTHPSSSSTRIRLRVPRKPPANLRRAAPPATAAAAETEAPGDASANSHQQRQQRRRRGGPGLPVASVGLAASHHSQLPTPAPAGMVLLSQLHSATKGTAVAAAAAACGDCDGDDIRDTSGGGGGGGAAGQPPQFGHAQQQGPAAGPNERLAQQAVDLLDRLATPQVLMVGPAQDAAASNSPMLTPLAWLLKAQVDVPEPTPTAAGAAGSAAAAGGAAAAMQSPTAALLAGLLPTARTPAGVVHLAGALPTAELEAMLEKEDWSIEGLFGSLPTTPVPPPAVPPVAGLPNAAVATSPLPNTSSGASTQLPLCGAAAAAVAEAEMAAAAASTAAVLASPLVAVLLQNGGAVGHYGAALSNSMRSPSGADTCQAGPARQTDQQQAQQAQQATFQAQQAQQATPQAQPLALAAAPVQGNKQQQATQSPGKLTMPALLPAGGAGSGGGGDVGSVPALVDAGVGSAEKRAATAPASLASPSLEEWLRCC